MTVKCKISNCGYNVKGFCGGRVTVINEDGVCAWLRKPRWNMPIDQECKEEINIITLAKKEESKENGENV